MFSSESAFEFVKIGVIERLMIAIPCIRSGKGYFAFFETSILTGLKEVQEMKKNRVARLKKLILGKVALEPIPVLMAIFIRV